MKRSEINAAYRSALACFQRHHWHLPPAPRWDTTDFGLGDFARAGLTLVNLPTEPVYCEKLMYGRRGQITPCHAHAKKEAIICRVGELPVQIWPARPDGTTTTAPVAFTVPLDGRPTSILGIGEVCTANDDRHDNFFIDPRIGRFPGIVENEPALVRLVSEA